MSSEHDYLDIIDNALLMGETHKDRTGVGTQSLHGIEWRHDMRDGFPALTTRKVSWRLALAELQWMLSGSTHVDDLTRRGVNYWEPWATAEKCAKFGREPGNLGPTYGHAWRRGGQLERVVDGIGMNPNSRRHLVSAWWPDEVDSVELPPCHFAWQVKIREDESLSMSVYMRSVDLYLGMPYDIMLYAHLMILLSAAVGRTPSELRFSATDAHLYLNHIPQAQELTARSALEQPKWRVVLPSEACVGSPSDKLLACVEPKNPVVVDDYKSLGPLPADVAV